MSIRIKAKPMEVASKAEEGYLARVDAVRLTGIKAEMNFRTTDGFIEHETGAHDYLPCFRMIGRVTEITSSDFPYNISALYFSEYDSRHMTKTIYYYPTPEEISHLVEVGKFYTKYFRVPETLTKQNFSFPCEVNLTIIPPYDMEAYERNALSDFSELTDTDKMNLPIVYVDVVGTGVSKRNDRLLAYYDIDIEKDMQHFVLTAESSGYYDPALLTYIEEPQMSGFEKQFENEREAEANSAEKYADVIQHESLLDEARRQVNKEGTLPHYVRKPVEYNPEDYFEATPEEVAIAQVARNVSHRLEDKFGDANKHLSLASKSSFSIGMNGGKDDRKPLSFSEVMQSRRDPQSKVVSGTGRKDSGFTAYLLAMEKARAEAASRQTGTYGSKPNSELAKAQGADVADAREQAKVDEAHVRDVALDAAIEQHREDTASIVRPASSESMDKRPDNPDMPQQQADVKMDLDPERNTTIQPRKDENEGKQPDAQTPNDSFDVEKQQGGDVADARAQAKVDEAHTRDIARDAAVGQQQASHREVSAGMEEITQKYDQAQAGQQASADNEYA